MSNRPHALSRTLLALALLGVQALVLAGATTAQSEPPAGATPPARADVLIARVYFADVAELNDLVARYDALEYADHQAGYVELLLWPGDHAALLAAGYRVEIDQARSALLNQPQTVLPAQASGVPGYTCYRTVEETYAALAQIAAAQPGLATWLDIGDSWEKQAPGGLPGYDLRVLVLTNKALPGPKPVFFLMAAIHAREYATAEQATRYAEYLAASYGQDPDVTWLLDHFEVHLLPQANPDGRKLAEAGYYHRKNTNPSNGGVCDDDYYVISHAGIDLNRNSSFQWGGVGTSANPCSEVYRGPQAASEPEVQAIQAYLASVFSDQRGPALTEPAPVEASGVFITLHSYGELVLFPWGSTTDPAPNADQLQTLGRKFGFFNRHRVCASGAPGCLYQTSGTTDDWAYGELGVAAYTFEMGDHFFEDCGAFESDIFPANQTALLYALKAARRPYQAPAGPETLTVTVSSPFVVAGNALTLTAVADDGRYYSGGTGVEPTQTISAARYSLDAPSWLTATVTLPLAASDGAFDASQEHVAAVIDTSAWPAGRHLLFVESQDALGNWGVPSAVFVRSIPADWRVQFFPLIRY
jgi:carboxypeptidase T